MNYRIETITKPARYWTNRGWSNRREDATVYTESQRRTSIELSGRGMPSFLPRDGCWVIIDEPDEAWLQQCMKDTEHLQPMEIER